jgi:hypothetical protein
VIAGDLSDFDPDALAEDFAPQSTDDANRLLWHLRRATAEVSTVQALYDAERARMDTWLAERTAGPLARIAELERALDGWARMVHAADPKAKTWALSNGTVRVRPARASVEITDASFLIEWAKRTEAWELLTLSPSKAALARLPHVLTDETEDCIAETFYVAGEPVPGCALVTAKTPNVTVKVVGDE